MFHTDIEAIARELREAQEAGRMVAALPSSREDFDLDAAYAVEATLRRWREASGHRMVGRKMGYANKAMWRILKLETLVWAHMYDDTVHQSERRSDTSFFELSLPAARSLKVEPEIVFGLKRTLAPDTADAAAALEAAEWLALGFEVIDCPFADWKFQPEDFVASYGLHTALVIGARDEIKPDAVASLVDALAAFKARTYKNGEFVEEGSAKNVLRSPALCLAELAKAVSKRTPNEPLAAGEILSTGTITAGHPAARGDEWKVEVNGLDLPSLTVRIA